MNVPPLERKWMSGHGGTHAALLSLSILLCQRGLDRKAWCSPCTNRGRPSAALLGAVHCQRSSKLGRGPQQSVPSKNKHPAPVPTLQPDARWPTAYRSPGAQPCDYFVRTNTTGGKAACLRNPGSEGLACLPAACCHTAGRLLRGGAPVCSACLLESLLRMPAWSRQ